MPAWTWKLTGAAVVALGLWWAKGHIEQAGYDRGYAAGRDACQQLQLDELREVIASTRNLTATAHQASQQLSQAISARAAADAQTTREIRNALESTAHLRVDCVFDDGVMRQLAAARERAAAAAVDGLGVAGSLGSAVPATDRAAEQPR